MKETELQTLLDNLIKFKNYYHKHEFSLITKIYGIFQYVGMENQETYLLVMRNIANGFEWQSNKMNKLYDLKGS